MGLFPENMDILINQINCKNIFSGWSCHATCRHVARVPVTIPPPTEVTQMLLPPHLRDCLPLHWLAQVSGLPSSDIGLVGPRYCRLSHSKIQYKYCQLTLNIFALDMLDIFRRVERCYVDTEAELPRPTATTATCPASGVCWVERPNNCVLQF